MATTDNDLGRLLLEQEERTLARKRAAIKDAGAALAATRKSAAECREALATLRELGFSRTDIAAAFDLTKEETVIFFPRKTRRDASADALEDAGEPVRGAAQ